MNQVVGAPTSTKPIQAAPNQGGSAVVAAYAITIFSSAFLLFQVQPLISKFILPWFGGSPAVWTAAMLFFQVVLFGGYLYAHLTSTHLAPRWQFGLHLLLLAAAAALALYTRISPSDAFKPTGDEKSPLLQILLVLSASVGLPYFALSSTGPLLQKWFSDAFEGASPYRLFALSNVGSLLALLSYPFFFEVHWNSRQQASMWSLGFAAFAIVCSFCAWWTLRAREAAGMAIASSPSRAAADAISAPRWWLRAAWILLPMLASIMFLAITNEVCQNVAPAPLLWIIPLSLYLISFIVAFDHPRWYNRGICAAAALVFMAYLGNEQLVSGKLEDLLNFVFRRADDHAFDLDTWIIQCTIYFSALFLICLICHCELAALKPGPRFLTGYFLSMSLGGAIGGLIVNLTAPHIFTTFFELSLALIAATGLAGWILVRSVESRGRAAQVAATLASAACAAWMVFHLADFGGAGNPDANNLVLYRGRNFFGLVSVQHRSRNDPRFENYALYSGHIMHGQQYAAPARRRDTEVTYYGKESGCGIALGYKLTRLPACRIGVVGLGVGTITAYARPTDYVRIYEINPEIINLARHSFYYLKDCPAKYDIVIGDARLKLEQELAREGGQGNEFDVLVLDAFSGDAIPTHLLTTESFAIYKRHLKPDGIIAAHITNSYLDLYPVVKRLAQEHGFGLTRIYHPSQENTLINRSYYALLTSDQEFLRQTPESVEKMPADMHLEREIPLWTDQYHNLFQIVR